MNQCEDKVPGKTGEKQRSNVPFSKQRTMNCGKCSLLSLIAIVIVEVSAANSCIYFGFKYKNLIVVIVSSLFFLDANSKHSRANMLVSRTSNFQGGTIRSIVPRHKQSIFFIVYN